MISHVQGIILQIKQKFTIQNIRVRVLKYIVYTQSEKSVRYALFFFFRSLLLLGAQIAMTDIILNAGKSVASNVGSAIGKTIMQAGGTAAVQGATSAVTGTLVNAAVNKVFGGEKTAASSSSSDGLAKFATKMEDTPKNKLTGTIGREREILAVITGLSSPSGKNNVLLLGEAGVGKTSLVEQLAIQLRGTLVPEALKNTDIWSVNIFALVAASRSLSGNFRDDFRNFMDQAVSGINGRRVILFIDEIHVLFQNPQTSGSNVSGTSFIGNVFKTFLTSNDPASSIKVIGATTNSEYDIIRQDPALDRRFLPLEIREPTLGVSRMILLNKATQLESQLKGVKIAPDAIDETLNMTVRFMTSRRLPDKALDVLTRAATTVSIESEIGLQSRQALYQSEVDILRRWLASLQVQQKSVRSATDNANLQKQIKSIQEQLSRAQARSDLLKNPDVQLQLIEADIAAIGPAPKSVQDQNRLKLLRQQYKFLRQNSIVEDHDKTVRAWHVDYIVSQLTRIPIERLSQTSNDQFLQLPGVIDAAIVGQKAAKQAVLDALKPALLNLRASNKPMAVIMMLGPTGTGKTELSKSLASFLFGSSDTPDIESVEVLNNNVAAKLGDHFIKFDMGQLGATNDTTRLIGSPPSYVGSDRGGVLTEAVRQQPHSLILLDEMEKSSPEVRDLFLSVFDDAALSDNRGRVDFSNTIIIMTSNVGAEEIINLTLQNPNASQQDYLELATQALRRPRGEGRSRYEPFTDEFLNRIDQICVFKPFSFEELVRVARRWVDEKNDLLQKRNLSLVVDNDVLILVAQESSDEALKFNARAVRRQCERIIGRQIDQWLTNNLSASNQSLHVSLEPIGDNTPDLFRVIIQVQ